MSNAEMPERYRPDPVREQRVYGDSRRSDPERVHIPTVALRSWLTIPRGEPTPLRFAPADAETVKFGFHLQPLLGSTNARVYPRDGRETYMGHVPTRAIRYLDATVGDAAVFEQRDARTVTLRIGGDES
jgi:hypothetical protein